MAALSSAVNRSFLCKSHAGAIGICYVQLDHYSTPAKKINLAALKRGTGGRSSFNGLVATVFGNSGFVGRYVCNRLGKIGTQLILPYRCDFYSVRRLKLCGDLGQVLFQSFDLRDEDSIFQAVQHSNVVINLIGRDWETKNFKFNDVHVDGARAIARASRKAGVDRLIHLSHLNASKDPEPMLLKNGSGYMKSKWYGEQAVLEEFPDATIIKAADIYGAEDRFLTTYTHFWRRQGTCMPLWYAGEKTEKQPIFVSDVAAGIVAAVKDPDSKGQIYQAIGPKRYQLSEMVDWFFALMRRDKDWGYSRYDLRYDPLFKLRVTLSQTFSLDWPFGNLYWEGLEKEHTTDCVKKDVRTLEDLGITDLMTMEQHVPWQMKWYRLHRSYMEELGEFPDPPNPPIISC